LKWKIKTQGFNDKSWFTFYVLGVKILKEYIVSRNENIAFKNFGLQLEI